MAPEFWGELTMVSGKFEAHNAQTLVFSHECEPPHCLAWLVRIARGDLTHGCITQLSSFTPRLCNCTRLR